MGGPGASWWASSYVRSLKLLQAWLVRGFHVAVTPERIRLLVLEDEQTDVDLTLLALTRFGLRLGEVVAVATEAEFLRSLDEFEPDVILCDYTLPGFSGEEALRAAAERCPQVPFIFVSGMLGEDRAVELLKAGAWDYVLKDRLARLGPAVSRSLAEAREAAARLRLEGEREAALHDLRCSRERLRSALDRLAGLQATTAALAGALTERDVARVLAEVTSPLLGASAGLLLAADDAGGWRRPHVWAEDGSTAGVSWSAAEAGRSEVLAGPALFLGDADAAARALPGWRLPSSGRSFAVLPLGGARPGGLVALMWSTAQEFGESDRTFLTTVGVQCTQALDRVRLIESHATVAQALQRALLPEELPEIPGVHATARYVPAHGDAVGGDWYDLLPLPDGGVALVMGDVEGHSVAAAAAMGQARNVLRAYASERHSPAEIMRRLNRFVTTHLDTLITCCYAELDAAARVVTTVSAGHPRPVIVDASGRASELQVEPGLPLGLDEGTHYREHTSLLPAGGWLVLFTDGLVDGDRAIHRGMDGFLARIASNAGGDPTQLADALVQRPAEAPPLPDDAALLVVQLRDDLADTAPGRVASRTFRATAAATPSSRHFLLDVLAAWQLNELQDVAALAASELVTNAVLHTAGDVHLTVRRLGESQIWIGVTDDSDRLPQIYHAAAEDIAGRGLAIVDLVSDEWGVDLDAAGGKTVWLRLSRSTPDTLLA
jgi:CheY-like chemotaxis protein/anti-sigma regulatory factor (Ser/Thr protein kinase)